MQHDNWALHKANPAEVELKHVAFEVHLQGAEGED